MKSRVSACGRTLLVGAAVLLTLATALHGTVLPGDVKQLANMGIAATDAHLYVAGGTDISNQQVSVKSYRAAITVSGALSSWISLADVPGDIVPSPYSLVSTPQPQFDTHSVWAFPPVVVGCTASNLDVVRVVGAGPLCYYYNAALDQWPAFAAVPVRNRYGAAVLATQSHLIIIGGEDVNTRQAINTYEVLPLRPSSSTGGNVGGTPYFAQGGVSWSEIHIPATVSFAGLRPLRASYIASSSPSGGAGPGEGDGVVYIEFKHNGTETRCYNSFPFDPASGTIDFSRASSETDGCLPATALHHPGASNVVGSAGRFFQFGPDAAQTTELRIAVSDAFAPSATSGQVLLPTGDDMLTSSHNVAAVVVRGLLLLSGTSAHSRTLVAFNVGPEQRIATLAPYDNGGTLRVGRTIRVLLQLLEPSAPSFGSPTVPTDCQHNAALLRLAASSLCVDRVDGIAADISATATGTGGCGFAFQLPQSLMNTDLFVCVSLGRCPPDDVSTPTIAGVGATSECVLRGACPIVGANKCVERAAVSPSSSVPQPWLWSEMALVGGLPSATVSLPAHRKPSKTQTPTTLPPPTPAVNRSATPSLPLSVKNATRTVTAHRTNPRNTTVTRPTGHSATRTAEVVKRRTHTASRRVQQSNSTQHQSGTSSQNTSNTLTRRPPSSVTLQRSSSSSTSSSSSSVTPSANAGRVNHSRTSTKSEARRRHRRSRSVTPTPATSTLTIRRRHHSVTRSERVSKTKSRSPTRSETGSTSVSPSSTESRPLHKSTKSLTTPMGSHNSTHSSTKTHARQHRTKTVSPHRGAANASSNTTEIIASPTPTPSRTRSMFRRHRPSRTVSASQTLSHTLPLHARKHTATKTRVVRERSRTATRALPMRPRTRSTTTTASASVAKVPPVPPTPPPTPSTWNRTRTASTTIAVPIIDVNSAPDDMLQSASSKVITGIGVAFAAVVLVFLAVMVVKAKIFSPKRRAKDFNPETAEVVHDSAFLDGPLMSEMSITHAV